MRFARSLLLCLMPVQALLAQQFYPASELLQPAESPTGAFGASIADFNGDGYLDLYRPGRLYRNQDGEFRDVLPLTGIDEGSFVFGAVFGDYDGDGDLDVFFEDFEAESRLYRNDGDLSFTWMQDIGLSVRTKAQTAAWADFNRDGFLDLFVSNDDGYNQLFKNLEGERFLDVSSAAGTHMDSNAYGASWADVNHDGWPDLFVAACNSDPARSVNRLLLNNGDETFSNATAELGVLDSLASWGVAWLDYNNDFSPDLYITNTPYPPRPGLNKLFRKDFVEGFVDATAFAGVAGDVDEVSLGVAAADFDNDGWTDLYVANNQRAPRLYRNNADGTFTDRAQAAGLQSVVHGAVAAGDVNNDGWIDLFTTGGSGSNLHINEGGINHWAVLSLQGTDSNRDGIGGRLYAYAKELRQLREIQAGNGFTSQSDQLRAHFGLGPHSQVDSVLVFWPSGLIETYFNLAADRFHVLVEGTGRAVTNASDPSRPSFPVVSASYPSPFQERTQFSVSLPRPTQVRIDVIDLMGREIASLVHGWQPAGHHRFTWVPRVAAARRVAPGLYLIRFRYDGLLQVAPVLYVR